LNMEQAPTQRPPPVPPPKPAHMLRHACQSPQVPEVESPSGTAAPPPQLSDDSTDSRLTGDIPLQNESLNNPQSMTRWSDAVVCVWEIKEGKTIDLMSFRPLPLNTTDDQWDGSSLYYHLAENVQ
jgi:hypothetical protein